MQFLQWILYQSSHGSKRELIKNAILSNAIEMPLDQSVNTAFNKLLFIVMNIKTSQDRDKDINTAVNKCNIFAHSRQIGR